MANSPLSRTKVFISYSHEDKKYLDELQVHLGPLARNGRLEYWNDTMIKPGSQWRKEIREAINSAKVALLLISADFLNSEFITTDELPPLLAAAKSEGITILPVIVRPCVFKDTKLEPFQSVNPPSQPLSNMRRPRREKEWVKIVELVIDTLHFQSQEESPTERGLDVSADDLIINGKYLNIHQSYSEAATILQQACQLKSDSFDAWFEYAYALSKLGRNNEAAKAFERAKILDPQHSTTIKGQPALSDSEKMSIFSGIGSGTFNHGLGTMPDAIILTTADGSQGIRYDNVTSTQVRVINNSPTSFTGLAIKLRIQPQPVSEQPIEKTTVAGQDD